MVDNHEAAAILSHKLSPPVRRAADLAADGGILHRAPAPHLQGIIQMPIQSRTNDQALGWHSAHQMMKLAFNGFDIIENVRVIEFQVVENQGIGSVMNKFGALVEEGAIVLVCLDHEKVTAAQPGGHREILGHTAHQVSGIKAGLIENPQQHGRCGGFAMGTGYGHHPAVSQHLPGQPFGARHIINAPVEHCFHFWIAPGHGVPDQHQIRFRLQILGTVTLRQCNALGLELSAHGGINTLVRTSHLMPQLPGDHRQTAHERAANAQNMYMH